MRVLTGRTKQTPKNEWNLDTHGKTPDFNNPHTTVWEYKPDHRSSVGKDPEDAKLRHLVVADGLPIPVNEEARRDHGCTSARATLTEKV